MDSNNVEVCVRSEERREEVGGVLHKPTDKHGQSFWFSRTPAHNWQLPATLPYMYMTDTPEPLFDV